MFAIMRDGVDGPISTLNIPCGDVVPTPTSPLRLERVDIVSTGMPNVDVAMFKAWSTPFCTSNLALVVPNEIFPDESNVVVAMPPKNACAADICVVEAPPLNTWSPVQMFELPRLSESELLEYDSYAFTVVGMTEPVLFVESNALATFVIATLVVVAWDAITFPLTARFPVVVAPPEIVSPPACAPLPIVEEACERMPLVNVCS